MNVALVISEFWLLINMVRLGTWYGEVYIIHGHGQ